MEKAEWLSQVRKGILEYSILLMIKNKSIYGYELITAMNRHDVLSTTEGTLYPLLKRLEKEELITATWKETTPGVPPRKYYDLTTEGCSVLDMMNREWDCLISAIVQIKSEEECVSDE
ncbi:MAG: PadR family transcriptional regulator [Methanimicrococcus sp.]|nr:PadR family transcriptional regulator [Methanimicrococcus sp.]